jgi:hypothetical protein
VNSTVEMKAGHLMLCGMTNNCLRLRGRSQTKEGLGYEFLGNSACITNQGNWERKTHDFWEGTEFHFGHV